MIQELKKLIGCQPWSSDMQPQSKNKSPGINWYCADKIEQVAHPQVNIQKGYIEIKVGLCPAPYVAKTITIYI